MKNILPLPLSGLLIAAFAKVTMAKGCFESMEELEVIAIRCVSATISDMPQNLNVTADEMYFDNVTIKTLTAKSFIIYPLVKILVISSTTIGEITDRAFLMPLENLQFLNVTHIAPTTPFFPDWTIPAAITHLGYTNCGLKRVNFTGQNFPNVEIMDFSNNKLTSFPVMGAWISLGELHLNGNPDIVVFAENLYPLCGLKELWLDSLKHTGSRFTKTWTMCDCLRLRTYIQNEDITTNFAKYLCENVSDEKCSFNYDGKYVTVEVKSQYKCVPPNAPPDGAPPSLVTIPSSVPPPTTEMQPSVAPEVEDTWLIKAFSILVLLLLLTGTIFMLFIHFRRRSTNEEKRDKEPESTKNAEENKKKGSSLN